MDHSSVASVVRICTLSLMAFNEPFGFVSRVLPLPTVISQIWWLASLATNVVEPVPRGFSSKNFPSREGG